MKKIIFLLLLLDFTSKALGQPTYSATIIYKQKLPNTEYVFCDFGLAYFKGKDSYDYSESIEMIYNDIKINDSFELSLFSFCEFYVLNGPNYYDCGNGEKKISLSASELIKNSSLSTGGCTGTISLTNFKPNVTIANSKSSNEICSGEEIVLQASPSIVPNRFPDEAYHWQYSFDGSSNWTDVPVAKNNTPQTSFSINEIIPNHKQYYNTIIYFRLGYDQNRPFTDAIPLKYSPCAPILEDRTYLPPDCSDGTVKSIVAYFDRKLELNETLYPLHIIPFPKPAPPYSSTPIFVQDAVTELVFDTEKQLWAYTFKNPFNNKLSNGEYYIIEYQAQINGVPKGTLESYNPFLYKQPTPVKFEIKKPVNPKCYNDKVEIAIEVSGGTGSYKFYVDGTLTVAEKNLTNGLYYIKDLDPKEYKIRVTDTNDCIDITAKD